MISLQMNKVAPSAPPPLLLDGESLDLLGYGDLRIIQAQRGFRFTIDPILLAGFAQIKLHERWMDLGCGSGVLPLLLAKREETIRITGVEIERDCAERAMRNVMLNGLERQIHIVHDDLRNLRSATAPQSFDVIITNPPYRRPESGRISSGKDRSIARHELNGCIDDFLQISRYLLKNGGRFYVIYLAERLSELLGKMSANKIEAKRLRVIHSQQGGAANLVLVEGRRSGRPGLTIDAPLFLYDRGDYTEEVRRMAGSQY